MQTAQENESSSKPAVRPLFSTGKKIVFLGALLIWGGFFLPWFPSIALRGPDFVNTDRGLLSWKLAMVTKIAGETPGGAEIPFSLGWFILGMAFLALILPDAFPELGTRTLRLLSLCALALGAATLVFLLLHNPANIGAGLIFSIAGYVLFLPGVLMDFAATEAQPRQASSL